MQSDSKQQSVDARAKIASVQDPPLNQQQEPKHKSQVVVKSSFSKKNSMDPLPVKKENSSMTASPDKGSIAQNSFARASEIKAEKESKIIMQQITEIKDT